MTLAHFNRRLHLYLGLGLLPWLFMYGVSSVPFSHNQYFNDRDAATGLPEWNLRWERVVDLSPPAGADSLDAFAERMLDEAGVTAPNVVISRDRSGITVNAFSFRGASRVRYDADTQTLTVEDRRFRWAVFLRGLHERSGFERDGALQTSWSVIVDLVSVAIVVWIASGLYMWWGHRGHRLWGSLALLGGIGTFLLFAFGL